MPELPEVETTLRGLVPHVTGQTVERVIIRNHRLRWPIPDELPNLLQGRRLHTLTRRAKYLLIGFQNGTLIVHLGMSGSLRIVPADAPAEKHDHFDLLLSSGKLVRMRDPRRFGAVLWHAGEPLTHPLLARLGPEPLDSEGSKQTFDAAYLYVVTRGRNVSIKQCIMDNHVVVGVGNIYSNEALFRAGIRPQRRAGGISFLRCATLANEIRATLRDAIEAGGSSLRDYVGTSGQPGNFQQNYWVYGRAGEPCRRCGSRIRQIRQGQRSTFYCGNCQR